jgi:hypothetical protein
MRAVKAIISLKEIIVIYDITIQGLNYYSKPAQIRFYTEHKIGEAKES